jgi:PAS domain S-box-containing protein
MPMSPIVMLAQEVEAPGRAVIATNRDGEVVYWGEGAEQMYGWARDEVMGRLIVDVTPSDASRDLAQSILETLRSGHPWSGEFQVRGKSGVRFDARVTDIPVHDKTGEMIGIVGISRRTADLDR